MIGSISVRCFGDGFQELWYLDQSCLEPFNVNFYSFYKCQTYNKYDGNVGNLIIVPQDTKKKTTDALGLTTLLFNTALLALVSLGV